jgi:nucleoid DNA-binding protein
LVWAVVDEMNTLMSNILDAGGSVRLTNVGVFQWVEMKPHRAFDVTRGEWINKPERLKLKFVPVRELRRSRTMSDGMDKYGVVTEDPTKEADEGKGPTKCPICGEKLDSGGACPVHGTEPFEKKENDE